MTQLTRNSYYISNGCNWCRLSGKSHHFKLPNVAIKPVWNGSINVVGCGLVLDTKNELAIFFTLNGILMGKFKFTWEIE
jgi:hypothetical protein